MKRVLSLILSLVMLISMLPAQVNAQGDEQTTVTENATVQGSNAVGNLLSEDIQQEQSRQEGITGYNVVDLTIEGNAANVKYSALADATVVVGIYDEQGVTLLAGGYGEILAGNGETYVEIEGQMPQYFRAIAYILDSRDHRPLCSAYETPMYTFEMQQLLSSTVEDYDEKLVLNLDGDSTTNFAVYNDNVVRVEEKPGINTLISAEPDSLTYVFENPDSTLSSLVYGDVLVYAYGKEELIFVKVSSVDMEGARVSIRGMALEMEDVFSHVKIEADADTSQVEVDTTTADSAVSFDGFSQVDKPATRAWEGDSSVKVEMNYTICDVSSKEEHTEFSLSVGLGLQIKTGLKYYIALRGSYIKFTTEVEAGVFMEATGKVSKTFPLGKFSVPVFPGLNVGFEPEFQISFEGKIDWSTKYKQTVGFAYEDGGFKNLTTNPEVVYSCEAEITVFVGFDLKPNFNVISPSIAKIEASIPIGFELKAKTTGIANDLFHTYDQTYHGCVLCLDGEIYFKIGLSAKIEILELDWLSCSVNIVEVKIPLMDFYYSFDKLQGGKGDCPFKKYPVTVETVDSNGNPISGVAVIPADTDWLRGTDAQGLASYFLEPGTYDFVATKDDMAGSARVEIKEPQKVKITLLVTGTVGQGVTWTLDKAGNLTVLGNGAIPDYAAFSTTPWSAYANQIKNVHIADGITAVGDNAFAACPNLSGVYIGAGVRTLSMSAWSREYNLQSFVISPGNGSYCVDAKGVLYSKDKTVLHRAMLQLAGLYDVPATVQDIQAEAFAEQPALNTLVFSGPAPSIAENAFSRTTLEAMYCTEEPGWTADKLQHYGGTITWTGYESILGSGTCGTNIVWTLLDDGTLVISGTGDMNDYTGYSYVPWYSQRSSIKKIEIKPGVTSLGNYAFYGLSNVTQVSLSQGLTKVGNRAFYNCSKLETAELPDSVLNIGVYAFYNCASLRQIHIPTGVSVISNYTFYGCSALQEVRLDGVTQIGDYAFYDNNALTSIVIPQGVMSVGNSAFYSCDGVTSIRIDAAAVQLGEKSFGGCKNVISLRFADSASAATIVGKNAFQGCSNLREIRFGSSVKEIGEAAFASCENLVKLIWGSGIQNVAEDAFASAPIAQILVADLSDWLSVSFENAKANPLSTGAQLLLDGQLVESVQIPDTVSQIKTYAFSGYAYLKHVEIPSSVSDIGAYAFSSCSSLETVHLSNGVVSIGSRAFSGCSQLQSIVIPDSVKTIVGYAFYNCSALSELNLPEGLESIGDMAFFGCGALESVSVPASVTTLGSRVFGHCAAMTGIWVDADNPYYCDDNGILFDKNKTTLLTCPAGFVGAYTVPSSVKQISAFAFWKTTGLESLSFSYYGGMTTIGASAFYECSNLKTVSSLPYTISSIGDHAFYGCTSLGSIVIPEKVTVIEASTYENCASVKTLVIPATITKIGQYAFAGCTSLQTVEFKGGAPTVNYYSGIAYAGAPFAKVTATAYCYDLPSWTTSIQNTLGTGLRWVRWGSGAVVDTYSVVPRTKMLVQTSDAVEAPQDIKTVSFSGLDAGEAYILLVLQNTQEKNLLAYSNLIYIWQTTADETGTAIFSYRAREGVETVYELICGGKKRDLAEATVIVPALTEKIGLQKFLPAVTLDGIQLQEDKDYELTGDVTFAGAGSYTCFIRGLGAYTGMYVCTYTVAENKGSIGLEYSVSADGTYYIVTGFGSCKDVDIVIPEEYNGLPVKEIGENAFQNCTDIRSVYLRGFRLEKIEDSAFVGCAGLQDVYYGGDPSDWNNIVIHTGNQPLLDANITYSYCLHNYVGNICLRCADIIANSGETVVLSKNLDVRNLCVPANIKLDISGYIVNARYFASFGDIIDTKEQGIIKADSYSFSAYSTPQYNIGYLPVYDTAGDGYRFFRCNSKNLGMKTGTDTVTYGFALDFENVHAYELLASTQDPRLDVVFYVYAEDTHIGTYAMDTRLIREYAALQQQYSGLQAAMLLQMSGLKALNDESTLTVSASLLAGERARAFQMGASMYFYELPLPENSYTVRYDANGGSGTMPRSFHTVGEESALRANAFVKEGYTFAGWKQGDGTDIYADGAMVRDLAPVNTTTWLSAQWIPNTYLISYCAHFTENVSSTFEQWPDSMRCTYDEAITLAQGPVLKGWTFGGWYLDMYCTKKLGDAGEVIQAANLTAKANGIVEVYGKWTPNSYTVVYDGYGATGGSMETSDFVYDSSDALRVNGYTKTGYRLVGWSLTPGGAIDFLPNAVVRNLAAKSGSVVILYAVWAPNTYTVHYDPADATGGSMADSQHTYDVYAKVSSNGYTKTGYHHIGWALTPGGEVTILTNMNMKNLTAVHGATVTLYSVWFPNSYYITYYGNGATGGSMEQSSYQYDTPGTLRANAFTKTGHTFAGWATSPDGPVVYADGATIQNLTTEKSATLKLYAKWTANHYTIVYHGNGATGGSTASTSHTYDVSGNLRANGFTRPNYTFLGWSTDSGAQKPTYSNGQAINLPNSGTVNLYAIWVQTSTTVGYYSRDLDVASSGYSEYFYTRLDKAKLKANGYTTLHINMRVDGQRWNWLLRNNEPYVTIYNSSGSAVGTQGMSEYPADWKSQYVSFVISADSLGSDGSLLVKFGTNNKKWQLGDAEMSITVT